MQITFFEQAGPGKFRATGATAGPWTPDAQHGGPPSALAARELDRHEPDENMRLARVAIDILRPVPVGDLTARTRTLRPGKRVALIETILESAGQEQALRTVSYLPRPDSLYEEICMEIFGNEPPPGGGPTPPPGSARAADWGRSGGGRPGPGGRQSSAGSTPGGAGEDVSPVHWSSDDWTSGWTSSSETTVVPPLPPDPADD